MASSASYYLRVDIDDTSDESPEDEFRVPPGRRLMNVIRNMRQNSGTAAVAETFDAERLDRRRR